MDALKEIGIKHLDNIDHYTIRSERDFDVLKIYYAREKGALFHKSEKFKFHRASKPLRDSPVEEFRQVTEVSPMLVKVMDQLDALTKKELEERDAKAKILADLKHLEKVVANKVAEIEHQLERL